jgi:two-component system response regulator YesN
MDPGNLTIPGNKIILMIKEVRTMYKILVAEDEPWIRNALIKRLQSLPLDIEIAGQASDGQEALELSLKIQPDIILTDIKMPCLNGLEFIKKIRQLQPTTKIIIISGYADFEYARTALCLGVSNYILKSIDNDTLNEILKEVIQQIEQESQKREYLNSLETKLIERTHILQQDFFYQLLSGKVQNKDYIQRIIRNLDLPFKIGDLFCILVLQLNQICPLDLITKIKRILSQKNLDYFIYENQQGFNEIDILLFASKQQNFPKDLISHLPDILIENLPNFFFSIGISNISNGITQFNNLYTQAIGMSTNKLLPKRNEENNIPDKDSNPNPNQSKNFTNFLTTDDQRNLIFYIESGNYTDIENWINLIFENIKKNIPISLKVLIKLRFEVIFILKMLLNKYNLSEEQVLGTNFISLVHNQNIASAQHLKDHLIANIKKVSECISPSNKIDLKTLLSKIKNYIENNYFENITLDTIAHKFFISKVYFSQHFKKEFGVNFITYVIKIRMEHAAQLLLKNRYLKINEVARMVGYSDPLYFGQVFKKYYGVLPSAYLDNHLKAL